VRSGAASGQVHPLLYATLAAMGLAALAAREVGWDGTAVILAVGGAAAIMPQSRAAGMPASSRRWLAVVLFGMVSFAAVRGLIDSPELRFGAAGIMAGVVAAVAEEVFFRRFLYGWLSRWGTSAAIVGSAVAFAVVHVPLYGAAALPVDLGAGLLLGWQRWATGGWTAPALTHVVANLLSVR